MSSRLSLAASGLALFLLLPAGVAQATPLPLDNSWVVLHDYAPDDGTPATWFTGTGTLAASESLATPFTWNSPDWVQVDITDLFVVGDNFRVYDNHIFVRELSGGPNYTDLPGCVDGLFTPECHWTPDPDVAWLDPVFNQGSLLFAPGSHALTIDDIMFPSDYTDGTVALRATPVPEPASLVLLGSGLFAAGWRLRQRARR